MALTPDEMEFEMQELCYTETANMRGASRSAACSTGNIAILQQRASEALEFEQLDQALIVHTRTMRCQCGNRVVHL